MRISDLFYHLAYRRSLPLPLLAVTILAWGLAARSSQGQAPPREDPAPASAEAPTSAEAPVPAEGPVPAEANANHGEASSDEPSEGMRFNFSETPWRDVLEWMAEEADLSLRAERYPPATLTFIDPSRTYSPAEALDQLNRLLLDRGFALVRRGRLLIVIDLEDPAAGKYIENIAEVVTPEELDGRGESDIVKCIFPLGAMTAEAAEAELSQMVGPGMPMTVLASARRVVVTDTVARLKAIRSVLEDAEEAGSEVIEIPLQHRAAEEVLMLARPLLELEDGENANEEIRIAVDPFGDRLYAVGNPAQISLLQSVIEKADKPIEMEAGTAGTEVKLPELRSYPVTVADPATVFDVLQTLLAGLPDTRLTIDPESDAVIAFARPETHDKIKATLDHLEGKGKQLEVIQLRRLEPQAALLTINKFFGKTEEGSQGPTVDGDPITKRLWVHGTPDEISKTKDLIEQLEGSDSTGPLGDRVRILPFSGQNATDTLEQVRMLWEMSGRKAKIRVVTPSRTSAAGGGFPQRTLQRESRGLREDQQPVGRSERDAAERDNEDALPAPAEIPAGAENALPEASYRGQVDATQLVTSPAMTPASEEEASRAAPTEGTEPSGGDSGLPATADQTDEDAAPGDDEDTAPGDIVISMTPQGMIVVGEDPVTLAEFEELMRTVTDQASASNAPPTVFWLKYVKASVASQMINAVLSGGDSGSDGMSEAAGSLLGELGGGMLGGLMGLGGGGGDADAGPILTATGSVSITPDDRLNALIVQANTLDMQLVEQILEVIDREESPEDVQTQAKPRLIPVIYQDAQAVAEIVKSVFADKMAGQAEGGGGRGGNNGQPSPQEFLAALRGGGRGGRGGGAGGGEKSEPPKVTIAVDQRSNALIVTATPQDYAEIRELVEAIDQGGMENEETVQVVQINGAINPSVVQTALESVLGAQAKTASSTAETSSSRPSSNADAGAQRASPDVSEIQRRIEMFRAMRSRGGPSGGGRGGPPGGGRGGPGGGRGGPGGPGGR